MIYTNENITNGFQFNVRPHGSITNPNDIYQISMVNDGTCTLTNMGSHSPSSNYPIKTILQELNAKRWIPCEPNYQIF